MTFYELELIFEANDIKEEMESERFRELYAAILRVPSSKVKKAWPLNLDDFRKRLHGVTEEHPEGTTEVTPDEWINIKERMDRNRKNNPQING